MKTRKSELSFSTTHLIILSFLVVILVGSLLLYLPISAKPGVEVSYIDALFTATTSTCVTGLVTVTTASTWSIFGQVVILCLIQIGGLGLITIITGMMVAINRRIGIKDSFLIQDMFNLNTLAGLSHFVKKVILGTFAVEGIGALLCMIVFVPEYGAIGVWYSVFHSVSSFCNAGIDIFNHAGISLIPYQSNFLLNFVTSALIIIGGIGYIVWWDVIRVAPMFKKLKFKALNRLTLQTKIAMTATVALVFGGGLLILLFEYNNPETIGNLSLFDKIQASFFQSVTTRTAGYMSISQTALTTPSKILSVILMIIGGSPVGTAGGMKTVTLVVLIATTVATIRNRDSITIFNRTLMKEATRKAVAVATLYLFAILTSTLLLAYTNPGFDFMAILYEACSATATVGLSMDLTPMLNAVGKIIIIITMYLGRCGPISLAIAFNKGVRETNKIENPTENISVG